MTQIFDSLGWALLHSIWQGAIALLAVLILRGLTKNNAPALRYNFQILCLFSCFAAFLATFGLYLGGDVASTSLKSLSAVEAVSQTAVLLLGSPAAFQVTSEELSFSIAAFAPLIGILWCLGFAFMAVRYLAAYFVTQKLRYKGLSDAPVIWQKQFRTLVLNSGVTENVRLFVSDYVMGPLTIGFMKPVVLVPTGFLMKLPRDQVEAILLHELAHIRRYDYLVNLFQTAIKTVLFFHPAIHYISNKIDIDREQACDDLAIAQSRDPNALACGLAALCLQSSNQGLAMAAKGGNSPIMDRLRRLVGSTEHQRRVEHLLMPLISTLLIGGIYLSTTLSANAHPETASYEHARSEKQNYTFKNTRINGRNLTVKLTEDGRRWVLTGGAWVDIDKSPSVMRDLPVTMPEPPKPPVAPINKNGEFDSSSFERKMGQFEIDMEYFEADLERYYKDNNHLNLQELSHLERQIERQVERAERHAERIQERVERQIERAEEQRERADEQKERTWEHQEQVNEIRERAKEATRHAREESNKQHARYNEMRETLYDYLLEDGLVGSRTQKVTMQFIDDSWTANGIRVASRKEDKYCELFSNMGIKKAEVTKIEIMPGSTYVVSESKNGRAKKSHKITIGKHIHKDGSVHEPEPPAVPVSPRGYPQVNPTPAAPPYVQKSNMISNAPKFMLPTLSGHINAEYGRIGEIWEQTHQGIDLEGETGAPVFASADGMVTRVTTEPKWGNRVVLKHLSGFQTLYGHMNSFNVSRGQYVKAGEVIGTIGSTGKSTGPHLHFEIRKDGQTLDPLTHLN